MRYNDAYAVRQRNIMRYAIRDSYRLYLDDETRKKASFASRLIRKVYHALNDFKHDHPVIAKLLKTLISIDVILTSRSLGYNLAAYADLRRLAKNGDEFAVAAAPLLPSPVKVMVLTILTIVRNIALTNIASNL